jgi:hypothetical protein
MSVPRYRCATIGPMAKKKNLSRKHRPRAAEAPAASTPAVQPESRPAPRPMAAAPALASSRDFTYVANDLRRIGVMAVSLVALEILLWYVLGHSSLGQAVYRLVQV